MTDFVGIPYQKGGAEFSGADCWGVTRLWLKHSINVDMDLTGPYPHSSQVEQTHSKFPEWSKIPKNRPLRRNDILIFTMGERLHSAPMATDTYMLNTDKANGSHLVNMRLRPAWKRMLAGVYRHKSML